MAKKPSKSSLRLLPTLAALTLLLAPTLAWPLDASRPASIQLTVNDAHGQALPGARIRLARTTGPASILTALTDAHGQATLSRAPQNQPAELTWNETLTIDKEGLLPITQSLSLFVGADIRQALTLESPRTTLLHILDSSGQPLPGARISLTYQDPSGRQIRLPADSNSAIYADENGDFPWQHGTLPHGFQITLGGHSETLQDNAQANIRVQALEGVAGESARIIDGRLLFSDGKAAIGWYVADGMGSIMDIVENGGIITYLFSAPKLTPVTHDGSFKIITGAKSLILISPQGVPILYELNPDTWPDGILHVTITVPRTGRTIEGTVHDSSGQPVANLPIVAQNIFSAGRDWDFNVAGSPQGTMLLPDGTRLGIGTDAQGRFALPVPVGTNVQVGTNRSGWFVNNSIATPNNYILTNPFSTPATPADVSTFKDISLSFQDEAGKPLENLVPIVRGFVGTRRANTALVLMDVSTLHDTQGLHYFLENGTDRLEVECSMRDGWMPFTKTIPLADSHDQHQVITLPANLRWQPLSGRLLDPAGQPVPNAMVMIRQPAPAAGGPAPGGVYGSENMTTDQDGRFQTALAPLQCSLEVMRFGENRNQQNLPGRSPPVNVSRDQRNLTIHLQPIGSIRLLLPTDWNRPILNLATQTVNASQYDYSTWSTFTYEPATHSLITHWAPPGTYKILAESLPEFPELATRTIDVQANQEAVLDLRNAPVPAGAAAEERWSTLQITTDGKPQSGAQVAVFTEIPPQPTPLGPLGDRQPDNLSPITRDLSNDQGTLRFKAQPGREYIAVAWLPGKLLGWQRFTLATSAASVNPPANQPDATLALQPTRSLIVHARGTYISGNGNPGTRELALRITSLTDLEHRALVHALTGDETLFHTLISTQFHLPRTAENEFTLDNLPINTEAEIRTNDQNTWAKAATLKVEPGDMAIEVKLND